VPPVPFPAPALSKTLQSARHDQGSLSCFSGVRIAQGRREGGNMPLIYIVFVLIIVGMGLWLINNFVPMAGSIKSILNVIVVVAVCVWVLKSVGLWSELVNYRVFR
jgi:hypothetical protein